MAGAAGDAYVFVVTRPVAPINSASAGIAYQLGFSIRSPFPGLWASSFGAVPSTSAAISRPGKQLDCIPRFGLRPFRIWLWRFHRSKLRIARHRSMEVSDRQEKTRPAHGRVSFEVPPSRISCQDG